ncbi:MAG TPA: serine/threonine-protein kinase, partial [Phycisphaerae bacterium]|nr:serine/threonine-protein kinase [Phycisphaerae bacterium]
MPGVRPEGFEFESPDERWLARVRSALHTAEDASRRKSPPSGHESTRSAGSRLGPYELVRRIGEGGMGTVWLARRADGLFERDVAVKFVRRGMDSDTVVRRFHNERAVLATLIHPNIGQMYDGGTTRAGHPYLVMEYVQGVPIIEYCESARLDIDDRLRLFRKVCLAAHHAHRHLILHRDVKPANILVADNGVPKLLDFGIAKLLDAHESGNSEFTATDLRPLTPRYASPEQVRGERLTTATDVYSLGVVLFELLTGRQKRKVDFRKGLR